MRPAAHAAKPRAADAARPASEGRSCGSMNATQNDTLGAARGRAGGPGACRTHRQPALTRHHPGLRREPTGCSTGWAADCVAVAKRDLRAGEVLDGEGGATVWGKCIPAARSRASGAVPIGLAHGVALARDVAAGSMVTEADLGPCPAGAAAEALALRQSLADLAG